MGPRINNTRCIYLLNSSRYGVILVNQGFLIMLSRLLVDNRTHAVEL